MCFSPFLFPVLLKISLHLLGEETDTPLHVFPHGYKNTPLFYHQAIHCILAQHTASAEVQTVQHINDVLIQVLYMNRCNKNWMLLLNYRDTVDGQSILRKFHLKKLNI